MKEENPEKIKIAKSLLSSGKSYDDTNDTLRDQFGTGLSNNKLKELKDELREESKDKRFFCFEIPFKWIDEIDKGIENGIWKDDDDALIDIVRTFFRDHPV